MEQVATLEQNTSSRPSQGPTGLQVVHACLLYCSQRNFPNDCIFHICHVWCFGPFPTLPLVSSPRVYPKAFAERIRVLFSNLVKNGRGKPELPTHEIDGAVAFENLSWSDWPEARLMGPLRYARGNKHLRCPPNWKSSFPKAIEILNTFKGEHWTVNP